MKYQTFDPIDIKVNETTNYLKWQVNGNGTVTWLAFTDACWAANPTPVGTHWYVSSCSNSNPYYTSGQTNVINEASGNYYNWDWGDDSEATYVSHFIKATGKNNGTYSYTATYSDSGEDANFLSGILVVTSG